MADVTAVLFDNFGPYHRARLGGAARRLQICGIELSGKSVDYGWDAVRADAPWEHITLIPGSSCRSVPVAELSTRMITLLDKIRPSAVAVPGWAQASSQLATKWCVENRVPAIVMSESCAHDQVRNPVQEAIKSRLVRLHSAALVGGSAHAAYIRKLGMPEDRTFIGYDAVDNDYFAAGADRARAEADSLRAQFGLPQHYFLASARFIAKKNILTLIEAFSRFCTARAATPDFPAWSLVLLGDGELAAEIRSRIEALGLAGRVILPGFTQYPELPVYYGLARAFIHASITEQWGLVVNEAMAAGLPVLVSSRCGCAPDLVREGENGFLFEPEDVSALSRHMIRIASGSCDLVSMGNASRRIVADFGPERFGLGLWNAVRRAKQVAPSVPGIVTRALLRSAIYRQARNLKPAKPAAS